VFFLSVKIDIGRRSEEESVKSGRTVKQVSVITDGVQSMNVDFRPASNEGKGIVIR
jgi:hypothetical protein